MKKVWVCLPTIDPVAQIALGNTESRCLNPNNNHAAMPRPSPFTKHGPVTIYRWLWGNP